MGKRRTVFTGAHSRDGGKGADKIGDVGKATRKSDIFHGQRVFRKKFFCFFTTGVVDILDYGVAGNAVEGARQIAFAHSRKLREIVKRQRLMAFRVNIGNNRFD